MEKRFNWKAFIREKKLFSLIDNDDGETPGLPQIFCGIFRGFRAMVSSI
jgi:hypothetical protein